MVLESLAICRQTDIFATVIVLLILQENTFIRCFNGSCMTDLQFIIQDWPLYRQVATCINMLTVANKGFER